MCSHGSLRCTAVPACRPLQVGVEQLELKTVLKKGGGVSSGGASSGAGRGAEEESARSPQPPSANSRTDESSGSEGKDRTTALSVDIGAVWANCAAPPKTAVMRKTDYTR